ncbi:hypothetical protein [Methanospirillum sp.]|jgi:hypothetical protein|uniref:hypothetical protein n=1 Tax=Methanospirillum sp. TaxID=45200 RepID=UPI0016A261AB|nr:hypothetical protein [Methanospirillum sp.]NLW76681.1 hypothetical protein [Methanomicrobiales archaeon]
MTNPVKFTWAGLVNQIKLPERPENFFRGVEKNFLHPKKPQIEEYSKNNNIIIDLDTDWRKNTGAE